MLQVRLTEVKLLAQSKFQKWLTRHTHGDLTEQKFLSSHKATLPSKDHTVLYQLLKTPLLYSHEILRTFLADDHHPTVHSHFKDN